MRALRGARPLVAALLLAAAGIAAGSAGASGGFSDEPTFGYGRYVREARAFRFCANYERQPARYRACLSDQALALVVRTRDPAHELPRIDRYAHSVGGFLNTGCHILMHPVGRRYARISHLTLAGLRNYLPRTNDPGCSAGFAHGLIMYLGPQIVRLGPQGAADACRRASTRYQRYSCVHGLGHAYMRLFGETVAPAVGACASLGRADAADCAQGAFHDYWIAVAGLDQTRRPAHLTRSPRKLCGGQHSRFVRACWFRAFLERPPKRTPANAHDVLALCRGLGGLQHEACVTGAVLIVSPDPFDQLDVCKRLRGTDAAACVRGVRVPSIALSPLRDQVRLVRQCANVDHEAQRACYSWLGEALNVIRNGGFTEQGCPKLSYAATRSACTEGARSYDGALQTFS
jgi:hypothetical protein